MGNHDTKRTPRDLQRQIAWPAAEKHAGHRDTVVPKLISLDNQVNAIGDAVLTAEANTMEMLW